MSKLLSIVIPVYNMEKYVQKTLDSLVCDKMEVLQIIVVNDGSTDGSLGIINEWASRYTDSVEVIDKANGGHGSAWNEGLRHATGDYLFFLDSDDWVENFSCVLNRLETASSDIVFNDKFLYYEPDGIVVKKEIKGISSGIHSFDVEGVPLGINGLEMFNFQHCFYRTSLLKGITFGEHTSYDDLLLFTMPLALSSTYEYTGMAFYVYRLGREGQSMAPEVILRKMPQQETQRKHSIDSALALYPKGSSGKKVLILHSIIRTIASRFYSYAMKLDAPQRKAYLTSWTEYVGDRVPECERIFEYRAYRMFPWPIFRLAIKAYHLKQRLSIHR